MNIRSSQAAPEEESGTVEEQLVAVAVVEESVVPNSAVDNGVDVDADAEENLLHIFMKNNIQSLYKKNRRRKY